MSATNKTCSVAIQHGSSAKLKLQHDAVVCRRYPGIVSYLSVQPTGRLASRGGRTKPQTTTQLLYTTLTRARRVAAATSITTTATAATATTGTGTGILVLELYWYWYW